MGGDNGGDEHDGRDNDIVLFGTVIATVLFLRNRLADSNTRLSCRTSDVGEDDLHDDRPLARVRDKIGDKLFVRKQRKKKRELKEAFEFADMSRKRKDKMATYKGSENERVKWDDANTRVLVEMCVAVMKAAKRVPGSRIPKLEWEELVVQFNAKTGLSYQKKSLKSKWDLLRKDWTLWAKMTARDTDIGWNDSKQTIDASDEWWEERIKENKEYAKFYKHGFKHKADLEFCFTGAYASGSAQLAPSSGYIPTPKYSVGEGTQNTQPEDGLGTGFGEDGYVPEPCNPCTDPPNVVNLGESPERVIEADDISSASSPTKGVPVTPSHTSGSMRKGSFEGSVNRSSSKKRTVTRSDEHETMVNTTTLAMDILRNMRRDGSISDDLYLFAAELFEDDHAKEIFINCEPDLRLLYLERKYSQNMNKTDLGGL
ncbi:L10-interacting MYB domain-containing protein-like [Tripterygium wilfordii]|uniref:L10-interacting MYB domain-containing protein-like n=1 Tax=Tripterygium wilfordii TaxID=458696 RepID=UPI0018F80EEB|nr:L10-interacting MYB domain-containing protein-like [Tripterygium wilfordii]